MNRNYEKKIDKWLLRVPVTLQSGFEFTVCVTVRDAKGVADSTGVADIEYFLQYFSKYWSLIFKKLSELNPEVSDSMIEAAMSSKLFVFSPAIVGSSTYKLMVLLDLVSDVVQEQSCMFCFDGAELILSEKHV